MPLYNKPNKLLQSKKAFHSRRTRSLNSLPTLKSISEDVGIMNTHIESSSTTSSDQESIVNSPQLRDFISFEEQASPIENINIDLSPNGSIQDPSNSSFFSDFSEEQSSTSSDSDSTHETNYDRTQNFPPINIQIIRGRRRRQLNPDIMLVPFSLESLQNDTNLQSVSESGIELVGFKRDKHEAKISDFLDKIEILEEEITEICSICFDEC